MLISSPPASLLRNGIKSQRNVIFFDSYDLCLMVGNETSQLFNCDIDWDTSHHIKLIFARIESETQTNLSSLVCALFVGGSPRYLSQVGLLDFGRYLWLLGELDQLVPESFHACHQIGTP